MALVLDPIYIVNLILSITILCLGYWASKRKKINVPLYIGIGFGLFGASHLATILGLKDSLESILIVVRLVGYLIVAFALTKY